MIKIDLRTALTDEAVEAALPNLGACTYSAPCIIGAMIPEADRFILDQVGPHAVVDIETLVKKGYVRFPDENQLQLAIQLQGEFDNAGEEWFLHTVEHVRRELAQ